MLAHPTTIKRLPKPIRLLVHVSSVIFPLTEKTEVRTDYFLNNSLKGIDALHLAAAEEGEANYFCTCDDGILRKREKLKDCKVKILTPIELVEELRV